MSASPPRSSTLRPTGRGWWLVAAAVISGLGVFLVLWLGQREGTQAYRADVQPPAAVGPAFRPLPTPSGTGFSAGAAEDAAPLRDAGARIDEPLASREQPQPMAPGQGRTRPDDGAAGSALELAASTPVPVESPSPRYPARALRRGESGEVLLRIRVDARGVPEQVEVASSSGSRDLDRAAVAGARRWRFRPAMRDGTAVAGTVNVPIRFDSGR